VADTMFYACALYLLCIIPQHSWSWAMTYFWDFSVWLSAMRFITLFSFQYMYSSQGKVVFPLFPMSGSSNLWTVSLVTCRNALSLSWTQLINVRVLQACFLSI
jgi:hypothetical protein